MPTDDGRRIIGEAAARERGRWRGTFGDNRQRRFLFFLRSGSALSLISPEPVSGRPWHPGRHFEISCMAAALL